MRARLSRLYCNTSLLSFYRYLLLVLRPSRHGHGILTLANGDQYEGQWAMDKKHGAGVYRYFATGRTLRGVWVHGAMRVGECIDTCAARTKQPMPPIKLLGPTLVVA